MRSSSASTNARPLRERLAAGETVTGTFLNTGSAVSAEICGRAGFDWVLVDLEHGSGSEGDLQHQLHALAATGTPAIVRVEANFRPRFAKALDLGAEGIMVPQVHSIDEARAAVSYMHYPPAGARGLAFSNRAYGFTAGDITTVQAADERVVGVIQIESERAVEHAAEIAALDGVDVLFVGPNDLSLSLGIHGQFDHPRYLQAVERVAAAVGAAGKTGGVLVQRADDLQLYLRHGFRLLTVGSDGGFLAAGARSVADATKAAAGI